MINTLIHTMETTRLYAPFVDTMTRTRINRCSRKVMTRPNVDTLRLVYLRPRTEQSSWAAEQWDGSSTVWRSSQKAELSKILLDFFIYSQQYRWVTCPRLFLLLFDFVQFWKWCRLYLSRSWSSVSFCISNDGGVGDRSPVQCKVFF